MSFDNWKKRAKSGQGYTMETKFPTRCINDSETIRMCEAAYKAGERAALKKLILQQDRRLRNERQD